MLRDSLKRNKGFGMVYVFMCIHFMFTEMDEKFVLRP